MMYMTNSLSLSQKKKKEKNTKSIRNKNERSIDVDRRMSMKTNKVTISFYEIWRWTSAWTFFAPNLNYEHSIQRNPLTSIETRTTTAVFTKYFRDEAEAKKKQEILSVIDM